MSRINNEQLAQEIIDRNPNLVAQIISGNTPPDTAREILKNLIGYGISCAVLTLEPLIKTKSKKS